jgi:acyl-CoA dehydrogenase
MSWDFETDSEFQAHLDWMQIFVREEVEPLDHVLKSPYDLKSVAHVKLVNPLKQRVKERGLWACHLAPQLGGPGFGQVKLALMNEIIGRSRFGPIVFGCQAPDSGNAEILAHFGTPEQKARFLQPLLEGAIVSCFAMTEPQGGSDPLMFTTTAVRDGEHWSINGEKWFASNAKFADFFIVMAVTDPQAPPYSRMSMLIVPGDTPGVEIVRNVKDLSEEEGTHAYLRFQNVEVPADHILGPRGDAFAVAQVRLGGGRVHHAMRTLAEARRAFEMMCERALSRTTQGGPLASKQMVQEKIADAWIEIEQFRLLVLRTAWLIDKHNDYQTVRGHIAAVKTAMPKVLHDVASRALHLHGALGLSEEMPFARQVLASYFLALADGPTEVHKITLARQILKDYSPASDPFPAYHLINAKARAREKFASALDGIEDL